MGMTPSAYAAFHNPEAVKLQIALEQYYHRARCCDIPEEMAGMILNREIEKARASTSDTVFKAIERASRNLVV